MYWPPNINEVFAMYLTQTMRKLRFENVIIRVQTSHLSDAKAYVLLPTP